MTRVKIIGAAYLAAAALAIVLIHARFASNKNSFTPDRDAYFIYQDSSLLSDGINPYGRIEGESLTQNRKYTFYLPAFLLAGASAIELGYTDFESWMRVWLYVSMVLHLGIGFLLYYMLRSRYNLSVAIFGSAFWLFGRWPLALFKSGQIDSTGIFPFVLAIYLLSFAKPKWKWLAPVSFGVSLAFKQIAAFVAPLFFIWTWQDAPRAERHRSLVKCALLMGAVPLLISLPFIIWDFESYVRMLIFPLTRAPRGPRSVDVFLGADGLFAKLPYFAMLFGAYYFSWKKLISRETSILIVMIVLISFNGVFFSRYFCWIVPLIPLVCFERAAEFVSPGAIRTRRRKPLDDQLEMEWDSMEPHQLPVPGRPPRLPQLPAISRYAGVFPLVYLRKLLGIPLRAQGSYYSSHEQSADQAHTFRGRELRPTRLDSNSRIF